MKLGQGCGVSLPAGLKWSGNLPHASSDGAGSVRVKLACVVFKRGAAVLWSPPVRRGEGEASQGSVQTAQPAAGGTHKRLQGKQRPSTLCLNMQDLRGVLFPKKPSSPGLTDVIMEEKSLLRASLLSIPGFPAVPHPKGSKDPRTSC